MKLKVRLDCSKCDDNPLERHVDTEWTRDGKQLLFSDKGKDIQSHVVVFETKGLNTDVAADALIS